MCAMHMYDIGGHRPGEAVAFFRIEHASSAVPGATLLLF